MVKKAIIPVAGYAVRMLPVTKVLPKAMLNVANKPVIEYIIDEIIDAGIEEILLITNSYSTIIQEHFSRNYELEFFLEKDNNYEIPRIGLFESTQDWKFKLKMFLEM